MATTQRMSKTGHNARRNLSQSYNFSQQKRNDEAFHKMMRNPDNDYTMRKFHDTISTIFEKKQVTSQRSHTTLEMSNQATIPSQRYENTDRRHAATASLKQRIKINQGLTDSLRKKLKTRDIYTRPMDMPSSTHRKIRVLNASFDFSNHSGPFSTIEPNYQKLQKQSHQQQYQAHMYQKYLSRRGKSSTIEEHINIPAVKSPTKVYNKKSILPE